MSPQRGPREGGERGKKVEESVLREFKGGEAMEKKGGAAGCCILNVPNGNQRRDRGISAVSGRFGEN